MYILSRDTITNINKNYMLYSLVSIFSIKYAQGEINQKKNMMTIFGKIKSSE